MTKQKLVGSLVRRFLMEYLVGERNLARNTQASYRDTLALLLPSVAARVHKPVDRLCIEHISPSTVRSFLLELEQKRGCSAATRNVRLAAIHALARFVGERSPEHVAWCTGIRAIPFKRTGQAALPYLEKREMDALLSAPDRRTAQGFRDYAVLLFLYNAGARADEAAHVAIADLNLGPSSSVKILGKGRKVRYCPLWPVTTETLVSLVGKRAPTERVFLNRRGQPLTRFGLRSLVKRYALKAGRQEPSLLTKRVSTHTIRHTTAVHLLRAGVDINTIRAWLGHVSLDTTNVYAEVDLEMKAKALAQCEIPPLHRLRRSWSQSRKVMAFLKSL